jgi:hypothetical protein
MSAEPDDLAGKVIGAAIVVHKHLGPDYSNLLMKPALLWNYPTLQFLLSVRNLFPSFIVTRLSMRLTDSTSWSPDNFSLN